MNSNQSLYSIAYQPEEVFGIPISHTLKAWEKKPSARIESQNFLKEACSTQQKLELKKPAHPINKKVSNKTT